MLLAAAYHLGLQVRRVSPMGFTGFLNVSTLSVRAMDEEQKPPLLRPEDGEPFRVLGHKDGKFFYLPAGQDRAVVLAASAHTRTNLVRLAPLEHWTSRFPPRDRRGPFDTEAAFCDLFRKASEAGIFGLDKFHQPRPR